MRKGKYISLGILFLILIHFRGNAQKNVDNQQLLWVRYNLKLKINNTYQIRQEFEERTYWFPWRQHQMLSKTHLERSLGNGWIAGVGLTYSEQSLPNNPNISDTYNVAEIRPQAEIYNKQILTNSLNLEHRYWAEFRFFEQPDGSFEFSNSRMRYKLELQYNPVKKATVKVFDEILINVGSSITNNVFDQNRYGGSVQYMPSEDFGFELGYINWFQQRPSGVDLYNRNIVRLTFHHNINLKKNKSHV
ncbi:DUF2490 domain-containing protein [Mariniflexile gromovii]|uniref:DUF2490 domain-containing protein n=1 Tax=Mariniflexile gromovii TaxID=362523 RepID=A0ABS4BRR5_9FLAO|nr:DUF2490 domain-containing protein [Mariniflexile gromovii]MBP0903269.1 DUF2490 domain-containing protein [Mariniflexile gromovii]